VASGGRRRRRPARGPVAEEGTAGASRAAAGARWTSARRSRRGRRQARPTAGRCDTRTAQPRRAPPRPGIPRPSLDRPRPGRQARSGRCALPGRRGRGAAASRRRTAARSMRPRPRARRDPPDLGRPAEADGRRPSDRPRPASLPLHPARSSRVALPGTEPFEARPGRRRARARARAARASSAILASGSLPCAPTVRPGSERGAVGGRGYVRLRSRPIKRPAPRQRSAGPGPARLSPAPPAGMAEPRPGSPPTGAEGGRGPPRQFRRRRPSRARPAAKGAPVPSPWPALVRARARSRRGALARPEAARQQRSTGGVAET
jgi:hypothetical protein